MLPLVVRQELMDIARTLAINVPLTTLVNIEVARRTQVLLVTDASLDKGAACLIQGSAHPRMFVTTFDGRQSINVCELSTVTRAVRHFWVELFRKDIVLGSDSQVTITVITKTTSTSQKLQEQLDQLLHLLDRRQARIIGFIKLKSEENPMDGPSRDKACGELMPTVKKWRAEQRCGNTTTEERKE
jgi:hypothetical protein